jgi:hypothetical protein
MAELKVGDEIEIISECSKFRGAKGKITCIYEGLMFPYQVTFAKSRVRGGFRASELKILVKAESK